MLSSYSLTLVAAYYMTGHVQAIEFVWCGRPARGRKKPGLGRNNEPSPGRENKKGQLGRRPVGSAGGQRKAVLMALQPEDYGQDGGMEWVAREQLRAEQRKLKLGMDMAGGGKGEMGRIYLKPSGPRAQGGPRAKRMFVPLEATQRAALVMAPAGPYAPYMPAQYHAQSGERLMALHQVPMEGVVMAQDFDYAPQVWSEFYVHRNSSFSQHASVCSLATHCTHLDCADQTSVRVQVPSGAVLSHAVAHGWGAGGAGGPSFPELNREQGSNYAPRTSTYSTET